MSCKIDLVLPLPEIENKVNDLLLPNEVSGVIIFNKNNEFTSLSKSMGSKDSVYTENHVINYHTHPVNAYNDGKTVWGWPSGEDIRESLKFALNGNKAHLVFTVEGLYTIQVSPCKISKIKELTDTERGVLIFIIEEYFKCTHNFRCVEEVNELSKKGFNISPYSYIDLINNFELSNVILSKQIKVKKSNNVLNTFGESFTRIPNIGFPDLDSFKIKNVPLEKYIRSSDLDYLYLIDKHGKDIGNVDNPKSKNIKLIKKTLKSLFKKFNSKKCKRLWNNEPNLWFHVNFFESEYYKNKNYFDNKYISPTISDISDLQLTENPYIKIFSDSKEGCSFTQIANNNNFKFGNNSFKTIKNSRPSTFGNSKLNELHYLLIIYFIENDIDSTESLIIYANRYITDNNIDSPLLNEEMLLTLVKK